MLGRWCVALLPALLLLRPAADSTLLLRARREVVRAGGQAQPQPDVLHHLLANHAVPAQLVHQHRVAGDQRASGLLLHRHLHRRRRTVVRGDRGRQNAEQAHLDQRLLLLQFAAAARPVRHALTSARTVPRATEAVYQLADSAGQVCFFFGDLQIIFR